MDEPRPGPTRVLVVDDEEPIRRNFTAALEDRGYVVSTAADGARALEVFAGFSPDIVLTDLRMPGMHGLALIRLLRDLNDTVPLVVVSGAGDTKEAVSALREGAWDYLLKPIGHDDELDVAIRRNIERSRLLRMNRRYQSDLEQLVEQRTTELRERERRLRVVADNTYDWEWWTAPDGRFLYCSPSCKRLTGWSRESLENDAGLFERLIHADDRQRVRERIGSEHARDENGLEFRLVRRDGTTRWVDLVHQPISDDEGRFLGHRGTARDITERKRLESLVLRMQRQEGLSRLSSGIAHDLNNVLAPIMMAGDLLQTASLTSAERECVEMIRTSSERGADMVRQLLTYSRGVDGHRAPLNPSAIVRDVARMVSETFPKGIDVRLNLPTDVWPVDADRTQLHQVVLNLCVNARDAMPKGGTLSMALERVDLDEVGAGLMPPARPGPYVVLTVADSGHGIAADILDKIFDPFFTTKEPGQGTGLGLATVHGIVASHGGFVDVHSVVGRGTEFLVYLPAAPVQGGQADAETDGAELVRGTGQRVLVVDDERLVREMLRFTLETHGYAVTTAESGAQALEVYGRSPGGFDVVLMDTWMPHMDGLSAIRRLARTDPLARVIAMSGLAEVRDTALATHPVVKMFLLKPWRTVELLAAIHDVRVGQEKEGIR
jgi:two-component system, cell cycle sensor histidine kinase and response regulator CckA